MNAVPIYETDVYVLFKEFECVFLFDKDKNKDIWRTELFYEATCGIIDILNEWVVVGGETVFVWKNNKIEHLEDNELKWIHDLRQISDNEIEILTDPWSEDSCIWRFNVLTYKKNLLRNFSEYYMKEYTENVIW